MSNDLVAFGALFFHNACCFFATRAKSCSRNDLRECC